MDEGRVGRLDPWMVVGLWALWLCSAFVFVLTVGIWVFWGSCSADGSPTMDGYLSVWPFGPGCRAYFDEGEAYINRPRPPGWAWTAVLAALVVVAVWMATSQIRTYRQRGR